MPQSEAVTKLVTETNLKRTTAKNCKHFKTLVSVIISRLCCQCCKCKMNQHFWAHVIAARKQI
jgi:hypothetical protein